MNIESIKAEGITSNAGRERYLVVYKYMLADEIEMPGGAKILRVQFQNGYPAIWALVDPYVALEKRHFIAVWTGVKFRLEELDFLDYIGTYTDEHQLVYHVFEKYIF